MDQRIIVFLSLESIKALLMNDTVDQVTKNDLLTEVFERLSTMIKEDRKEM